MKKQKTKHPKILVYDRMEWKGLVGRDARVTLQKVGFVRIVKFCM